MKADFTTGGTFSEMAIVDTFTSLIFGAEDELSLSEELIIQAFRMVETDVVLDSHQNMGEYLRALGVPELIQLVTRVQACLADGLQVLVQMPKDSTPNRRLH